MSRWNVVTRGRVVGEVIATEYAEALQAARDVYGPGVRVSAPGQASVERGSGEERGPRGHLDPAFRYRAERSGGTAC